MLGNSPFYFSSIRKYVTLFGSLFSNINITRTDANGNTTELMRVPITYGPKEKMLARVNQDPNIDRQVAIILPVMSFEMDGFTYDGTRKLQTTNRIAVLNPDDKAQNRYQYNPVPYNIGFKLFILVKNAEDGSKIVEQILPFFTPDWTVTAHLIPEMNVTMDIPIILNRVDLEDSYDGQFKDRRALTWMLYFTMKAYFYGPVKTTKVIKFANTEFFAPTVDYIQDAVGNSSPVAYITVQPGLTANGQPTSNASLSIPVADIVATDNYGFVTNLVNT
jgi:hypothetical protein